MNSGLLIDRLSDRDLERLEQIAEASGATFANLAELTGLDPAIGWRHLNLSGIDFSDSDLRGFDFTGADLRGCVGSNVTIDESTVLSAAQLDASIFELAASRARIFAENPELQREYRRITAAYWTDQHNWVCDILTRKGRNVEAKRTLALSLYFDAKDPLVRRTILFYLIFRSGNVNEALGFMARFISEPGQDEESVVSAIAYLAMAYIRNESAALLLLAIAEDEERSEKIRRSATAGVLLGSNGIRHLSRVMPLIREFKDRNLDNYSLRLIAQQLGPFHLLVVGAGKPVGGLNFQDAIGDADVMKIVQGVWAARNGPDEKPPRGYPAITTRSELVEPVVKCLLDLKRFELGLRFQFDPGVLVAIFRTPDDAHHPDLKWSNILDSAAVAI